MSEPIRSIQDVAISVHAEAELVVGTARPPSVGAIVQIRPEISMVIALTHGDFDRVWALAVQAGVKHAHFVCTRPHYTTALVTDITFSNEPIE